MKTIANLLLTGALAATAWSADSPVGRLPNGRFYIQNEIDFALKENVARAFSPANQARRAVPKGNLRRLHPAIGAVVGGHTAAANWLDGRPLPVHLLKGGPEVPLIARSLKARLLPGQDAAQVVEEFRQNPDVEWASLIYLYPVTRVPSDPLWTNQWGSQRVRADDAWDVFPASLTRRVAIIDTGVDLTHPDLAGRIVYNKGFGGNATGDAKRDRRGGDTIDHGTAVAGVIAAYRNGIGVAGTAWTFIMAMGCATWIDTEGKYGIDISWVPDAINDAVAHNADVINCSFACPELDSSLSSALDNAQDNGIVVVCAAGNDNTNVDISDNQGWNDHSWPLIVSNTQQGDTKASTSNFGPAIDLAAPGTHIFTTVTTNYTPYSVNGQYRPLSGTSMSAPFVAAGAVMLRSMNPDLIDGTGIKTLLYRMAEDLGTPGKDNVYGNGMLQLDPVFLQVLKDADAFVSPAGWPLPYSSGHFNNPYNTVATAVAVVPAGSTLVLNGGNFTVSTFWYPGPITITKACTLKAFPDHPVVIGE